MPAGHRGRRPRTHHPVSRRSGALPVLLTVLVLLAVGGRWVGQHPDGLAEAWAELTGRHAVEQWDMAAPAPVLANPGPPPGLEESPEPLRTPSPPITRSTSYAFLHTYVGADGRSVPAMWSPCRPIRYVINDAGAPPTFAEDVAHSLGRVSAVSGLVFLSDGRTDEPPRPNRRAYLPDRYGDRWAPVLIAFTDADSVPALRGRVAGVAGPAIVEDPRTRVAHLVSGTVYLDTELIDRPPVDGAPAYLPVLLHELGHLTGLDHVPDPSQLMYSEAIRVRDFQDGDLSGLAAVGSGPCAPDI